MATRSIHTTPLEDDFQQDESPTTELAVRRDVARVVQEVQGAIIVAQRFPRNEDEARVKLLRACKRPTFAENAEYEFPRGGNDVSGPSVQLAREAARVWGNIQYGFEIVSEDEVWRSIRAYAWDVETNSKPFQEDRFKKLIYRKANGGQWVKPDERDLRELTNRRAAICYRNCILQVIPSDLIQEAIEQSRMTLRDRAAADPDGERKRILDAFANDLNVMPNSVEAILGHSVTEASPVEIAKLRAIYKSIRDGNSTLNDYLQSSAPGQDTSLAGKSAEVITGIRDRYTKSQQPVSEGSKAAVGHTEASANPQTPSAQQTSPKEEPAPAAELSPAEKERKSMLEAEADRQKRALDEHLRSKKHGEHPATPLASPEGIFDDNDGINRGRRSE
jgi:hypothetical protein